MDAEIGDEFHCILQCQYLGNEIYIDWVDMLKTE